MPDHPTPPGAQPGRRAGWRQRRAAARYHPAGERDPEVPYLERLQASGGSPPYRFEVQRPAALDWVSLEGSALTGTPRDIGAGTLSISVHDALDAGVSASIPLAVVACQDGARYPCEVAQAGACELGIATCSAGKLGACGALQESNSVFGCGTDCGACDSARADHCQDGGTCACGTTGALCANGTNCCPGAGCVDLATDPTNCKSCGNDCTPRAPPHMDPLCGTLDCEFACSNGYRDCDAGASGCETYIDGDIRNCGGCGQACSTNHDTPTCSGGTCVLQCSSVPDGGGYLYANCDNDVATGCEADLANGTATCGSCNTVCSTNHATPDCVRGACGVSSCAPGYVNCNLLNDGCERVEDAQHCGSTCRSCPGPTQGPGHPVCSSGACQIACDSPTSICGTQCINLSNDPNHCGSCSNVCPGPTSGTGSAVCVGGTCGISCADPYVVCGTQCVLLGTKDHCASCSNACTGGAVCQDGACCVVGVSC